MKLTDWDHDTNDDTYTFELTPEEVKAWGLPSSVTYNQHWYGDDREDEWSGNGSYLTELPEHALNGADFDTYVEGLISDFDGEYATAFKRRKIQEQTDAAKREALQGVGGGITPPVFTTLEEAEAWLNDPAPASTRDKVVRLLTDKLPEITAAVVISDLANDLLTVLED